MSSIPAEIRELLSRHCELSPQKEEQLVAYVDLLIKWNASFNLVGASTIDDIWQRHIMDAVQLLPYIPDGARTLTDFGSGAGIPGAIIAILCPIQVHVIDSNQKKIIFLRESKRITESSMEVHCSRIEALTPWQSDVITARAFAPLDRLLEYTHGFATNKTSYLLLKGQKVEEEIAIAAKRWHMKYMLHTSIVGNGHTGKGQGVILQLQEVSLR